MLAHRFRKHRPTSILLQTAIHCVHPSIRPISFSLMLRTYFHSIKIFVNFKIDWLVQANHSENLNLIKLLTRAIINDITFLKLNVDISNLLFCNPVVTGRKESSQDVSIIDGVNDDSSMYEIEAGN